MMMSKDEFNRLDIEYQIEYVNSQLSYGKSITTVAKEIGLSRTTLRDRFRNMGYVYSKDRRQYMYYTDYTASISNTMTIATDMYSRMNGNYNYITDVIQPDVQNAILDIMSDYDVLKEMISNYKRDLSVVKDQLIIDLDESETKLTSIRINKKELDLFNTFCENNKQYTKIDLISMALKEFRKKYE